MKIEISSNIYEECEKCSQNRWSNKKTGVYGRGLINNTNDPYRAERIGLLGEAALAQYINRKVDYKYREGGNPFDFQLNNLTIDIKTAAKNYGCGLIRAQNQYKKQIELTSDIYVFGYIEKDDRNNKEAAIILKGWITKQELEKCSIVPARIGKHFNYEVGYQQLRPIEELRKVKREKVDESRNPDGTVPA